MSDTGVNNATYSTYGSYVSVPKLSKEMRAQALPNYVFRQFVDKKDGLGAGAGDTVHFSKRLRIDTAGGVLTETASMEQKNIKVLKGTATVAEYGNKVLYTQKMDTLAAFNMKSEYGQGLVDDQVAVIDSSIATQFKTAKFKVVCTASTKAGLNWTTNGTATATALVSVTANNMRGIIDYAKIAQIPKMGGSYICIGATNLISSIYDDLQAVAQYADPEFRFKDEVGRYYGTRFVEDNGTLDTTAGNSSFGEGVLFGDEAVAEVVALPEEMRYYEEEAGRFKYLLWYAILGHKKIWDRVIDGQTANLNGLERIIHITSA